MSDKQKLEEQPTLRRSSRSTRGSIKPILDLTKNVEADEEEVDTGQDEDVKVVKSGRRSSTKSTNVKKEPVKRGANKKAATKESSENKANVTKLEEEKEPLEETDRQTEVTEIKEDEEEEDHYYELNEKEMKEINNAFDMNQLGDDEELLNADGLRTAMRSLGFEPRGDEIKKMMRKFATKKGSRVTRDGFHKIMAYKYSTTPNMRNDRANDEISRVFNLLDLDKTGMITLENLKSISKELNEELTEEDLHEMISEADLDGDFKINKDEFYNIMKKTSLY